MSAERPTEAARQTDHDLAWAVEAVCRAACPSPEEAVVDGWLFRMSGGPVRRTNSVNPLKPGGDPTGIIPVAEKHYGALGRPAIFRVPSIVTDMDEPLARHGYAREGETVTLYMPHLEPTVPDIAVELSAGASRAWTDARARLSGASEAASIIFSNMLGGIVSPAAFVSTIEKDRIAALAYGVVHNRLLVIESVVTDATLRRRGHGRANVSALIAWGKSQGAEGACLQVEAENEPAINLYRNLGFEVELYGYHYRRQQSAAA